MITLIPATPATFRVEVRAGHLFRQDTADSLAVAVQLHDAFERELAAHRDLRGIRRLPDGFLVVVRTVRGQRRRRRIVGDDWIAAMRVRDELESAP